MAKEANYTQEMTEKVVSMYQELGNEGLEAIGEAVGKSVKSVRSKLVREGAYVAPDKPVRERKEDGPSKKELVGQLTAMTGVNLAGIEGANKGALSELISYLATREAE